MLENKGKRYTLGGSGALGVFGRFGVIMIPIASIVWSVKSTRNFAKLGASLKSAIAFPSSRLVKAPGRSICGLVDLVCGLCHTAT
jgi:hypothetical protein